MRVMVFVLADPLIRGSRAEGERGVFVFENQTPPVPFAKCGANLLIRGATA